MPITLKLSKAFVRLGCQIDPVTKLNLQSKEFIVNEQVILKTSPLIYFKSNRSYLCSLSTLRALRDTWYGSIKLDRTVLGNKNIDPIVG